MLTRKQVEEATSKTTTNSEAADYCGVSLSSYEKYKAKYKLTNKQKPIDIKALIIDRLKHNIFNVDSFVKENKIDNSQVYKILHTLEKEGYPIEKSLSGYYISGNPKPQDLILPYYAKHIKFGVVSDTHLGSTEQQLTHLNTLYDIFEKEKCKLVLHPGDLVDGENVFRGQKYEVFIIGADNQMRYAIDKYPYRKGITTYMISGNHDLDYQKTTGLDIVKAVSEKRADIKYCGQLGAYIEFGKKTKAYLYHPDGGGSYALSYKPQKFIANISPEHKPNIVFIGHYHQLGYFKIRNVHAFLAGSLQGQTSFLKRKGLEPQIGGWIIELNISDDGSINRIQQECITFFNPVFKDYD